jgi:hypothetical protein
MAKDVAGRDKGLPYEDSTIPYPRVFRRSNARLRCVLNSEDYVLPARSPPVPPPQHKANCSHLHTPFTPLL